MNKHRTLDEVMATISPERQQKINAKVKKTLATMQLSDIRKKQGISQQQLAEKLKISQSAISQLENQGDMQLDTLMNYTHALGATLNITATLPDGRKVSLV